VLPEICCDTLELELSCSLGAPMVRSRHEQAVFNKERPMMRRTCDLRQAPDFENPAI
jgi:hypothetical protein